MRSTIRGSSRSVRSALPSERVKPPLADPRRRAGGWRVDAPPAYQGREGPAGRPGNPSYAGRTPSVTSICTDLPLRVTVTVTLSPGAFEVTAAVRSSAFVIGWLSKPVITSPAFRPAFAAGEAAPAAP